MGSNCRSAVTAVPTDSCGNGSSSGSGGEQSNSHHQDIRLSEEWAASLTTRTVVDVESVRAVRARRPWEPWDASSSVVDLLTVMASTPALPGAACRGHHDLFDSAHGSSPEAKTARTKCMTICARCRVRDACHEWAAGLSDRQRRTLGVVGGIAPDTPARDGSGTGRRPGSAPRTDVDPSPLAYRHGRAHRKAQRDRISELRSARRAARSAASKAAMKAGICTHGLSSSA